MGEPESGVEAQSREVGAEARLGARHAQVRHKREPEAAADRVRAATDIELEKQTRLRRTEDFKEGVDAVNQRRMPKFVGR